MRLMAHMKTAGWICGLCLLSTAAHAEVDTATILRHYDEADLATKKYIAEKIADIENGMSWANADLLSRKQSPLYCPPQTMVLTGEQLIDILRREIKDEPWESTRLSFPAVLITALEKVFPCPTK